jgi:hypothetical protein
VDGALTLARWEGAFSLEASGSVTARAVRAAERNAQTLVFAVVLDGATAERGLTDAYALYRNVPGAIAGGAAVPVLSCLGGEVHFEDPTLPMTGLPVYLRKLATGVPLDAADATRAQRMHFPPVAVSVSVTCANGSKTDGQKRVSPAHVHRAMPRASLGARILQIFSVACTPTYCPIRMNVCELDSDAHARYDIAASLAQEVDLSQEPRLTQEAIAGSMNAFFEDSDKCATFLNEFNAKFPGVLTDGRVAPPGAPDATPLRAALRVQTNRTFAVAVYLNIEFMVPVSTTPGALAVRNRLNNVPIIFRLI